MRLSEITKATFEDVRKEVLALEERPSIEAAAQAFAAILSRRFSTVVLARVFLLLPFSALGPVERAQARQLAAGAPLARESRVLTLVGTSGVEEVWHDRLRSKTHLAMPLLGSAFVHTMPMIAKLLADLDVDLAGLDTGLPITFRRVIGGRDNTFYVPDAATAVDGHGRRIIPSNDFVKRYDVKTVFGMGGAYLDETLVFAIVFSNETISRSTADRFPSLITNFKVATSARQAEGRIFDARG